MTTVHKALAAFFPRSVSDVPYKRNIATLGMLDYDPLESDQLTLPWHYGRHRMEWKSDVRSGSMDGCFFVRVSPDS